MARATLRRVGWPLSSLPLSALTLRNIFIFVSVSTSLYTILTLAGVADNLKYNQFVTNSQSLVPSSWPFSSHDTAEAHELSKALAFPPPPPSDELSDFHIYNISKSHNANATKTWPRPQLHVLIDARHYYSAEERTSLLRTLLSVVTQGYPPPILIGYRQPDLEGKKEDVFSTETFLRAALDAVEYAKPQLVEVREGRQDQESIVLFLGRNQWVQMPAEVTVRRFLQHKEVWERRLARAYDFSNSSASEGSIGHPKDGGDGKQETDVEKRTKYGLGVLFPVSRRKSCAKEDQVCKLGTGGGNGTIEHPFGLDHRDDILPESFLPRDIYGTFLDNDPTIPPRYQRPRYLGGGAFIGSVGDVERLFRGALERIDWLKSEEGEERGVSEERDDGNVDELTYLFSEMFFEQEIERKRLHELDLISRQSSGETTKGKRRWAWHMVGKRGKKRSFLDWFAHVFGGKGHAPLFIDETSQQQDDKTTSSHEYEFGIGLDYESRLFQDMADDLPDKSSDPNNTTTSVQITNDIRYLSYNVPNLVRSPSRSAAHLFLQPLMLPPELLHPLSPNGTSSPFGLNSIIYNNLDTILEEAKKVKVIPSAEDIDQQKLREQGREKIKRQQEQGDDSAAAAGKTEQADEKEEKEEDDGVDNIQQLAQMMRVPWSSLEFATNIVVPRGSIPSILDMSRFEQLGGPLVPGEEKKPDENKDKKIKAARRMLDEHWEKMCFNQKKMSRPPSPLPSPPPPPPPPQEQQDKHHRRDDVDNGGKTTTESVPETEIMTETDPAKYDLLDEYNKPSPFIYALESEAWGGEHNNWWNVRGGRGGFWTDQGAWVSWYDVCGDLDV
ncbi:hypothetical protein V8F20_000176 [Naviculisporaceae sp. PSN 640]